MTMRRTVWLFLLAVLCGAARPAAVEQAFGRAILAKAEGRPGDALAHLAQVIEMDPSYWEAHRTAGECLLTLQRPQEAVSALQKAQELNPSDRAVSRLLREALDATKQAQSEEPRKTLRPRLPSRPPELSLGEISKKQRRTGPASSAYTIIGKPYTPEEIAHQKAEAGRASAAAQNEKLKSAEDRAARAERRAAEAAKKAGEAQAERDDAVARSRAAEARAASAKATTSAPPAECGEVIMNCGLHADIASWDGITVGADGKMYRVFVHNIYAPRSKEVIDRHRILIACPQ